MNLYGLIGEVSHLLILAQGEGAAPPGGNGGGPPANPIAQAIPMLVAFMVMFYFIILRPQQKETKRRKDLLDTLKKNDKVLTAGGIIGTIVDFSSDGSRVTLRVDDGTRIKFTRSSIQGPYNEKSEAEQNGTK